MQMQSWKKGDGFGRNHSLLLEPFIFVTPNGEPSSKLLVSLDKHDPIIRDLIISNMHLSPDK